MTDAALSGPLDLTLAREQIATAWCTEKNKHKVMDPDLAEACATILANWIESARQYITGMEYYRGLVDQCAKPFGEAAYICDDGSRTGSDEPLRAKVPELVGALIAEIEALRARISMALKVIKDCADSDRVNTVLGMIGWMHAVEESLKDLGGQGEAGT